METTLDRAMPDNGRKVCDLSGNMTDRRVLRTRKALWNALLALLREHDWDTVNVQTICERADVARSSFYAHFDNKAALLDFGFGVTMEAVSAEIMAGTGTGDRFATLDWFVDHVSENSGFLGRALRSSSGQAVLLRFRGAIADAFALELSHRGTSVSRDRITYAVAGWFALVQDRAISGALPRDPALKPLLQQLTLAVLGDKAGV